MSRQVHYTLNGLAEKTVQTVKHIFSKSKADLTDLNLGILEYLNIPIDGAFSPGQLLMRRRLRTILPVTIKSTGSFKGAI